MREIKFRAWCERLGGYFKSTIASCVTSEGIYTFEAGNMYLLEQYTGIKDDSKEEQELFEGDLIKNGNGKILLIYFNKLECSFRQTTNLKNPGERTPCYTDLPMNYNNKIKVGNIHENPELL